MYSIMSVNMKLIDKDLWVLYMFLWVRFLFFLCVTLILTSGSVMKNVVNYLSQENNEHVEARFQPIISK